MLNSSVIINLARLGSQLKKISAITSSFKSISSNSLRLFVASLFFTFFSVVASAADFDACPQHFYNATEPDYIETKLLTQSVPLCFNGFATLYSGVSRTPIWSAEHLTRERLRQAETIPREDSFHEESRLPARMRAKLADYKGSGYDRGHLAPNADMANLNQQYDSFSLANIIPQTPENNRYLWRNLESMSRYLTKKHGEIYVVTGVAFIGDKVKRLNNRILIPTHIFKAIYIPATGEAAAYYTPNDSSERVEVISLDELALRTGIDVFPDANMESKSSAMFLPVNIGEERSRNNEMGNDDEEPLWMRVLIEILRWVIDNILLK